MGVQGPVGPQGPAGPAPDLAPLSTRVAILEAQVAGLLAMQTPTLSWAIKAPMRTQRRSLSAVAAGNQRIYAIGGFAIVNGVNTYLGTVEEYNPATDTWATKTAMPTPRESFGAALGGDGKVYVVGGCSNIATGCGSGTPSEDKLEIYDPATDTWAVRAPMPTARFGLGLAHASNGNLYAIGGRTQFDYAGTASTVVEEYNPTTNTWTSRAPMPTARYWLGVVAASNGRLYAIGGSNIGGNVAQVEEYDPATDTWRTRSPMSTQRRNLGVISANSGRLYAVDGEGSPTGRDVEEYNPATDTWVSRTSTTVPRAGIGAAVGGNGDIYLIGGQGPDGALLNTVEQGTLP